MHRLTDAFVITSTLFENNHTLIYRATRRQDGRKVILKTHKRQEDSHKIKHEFDLLKNRSIAGISNVIDIVNNNDEPLYLVSEDHGAVVLEDYLQSHRVIDEDTFLSIAENASVSLQSIHDSHIIHRDIKPSNMLIDPEGLGIWYIDFGISAEVRRGAELWPDAAEGTLEYLSPEQTGRVNKMLDYRSDIYSLGITLYRILTGRLPFRGKSPMEMIHAHIAVAPPPPGEFVETQSIVDRGILKMIEKKPEQRYQTAASLVYDIQRCRRLLAAGEDCNAFMLAEKDIFYNLEPGRKLYGKKDGLATLKRVHEAIGDNRVQIVLLDGDTSVGKSMLLGEFEHYAGKSNSLLFHADYDETDQGATYGALRRAFAQFETVVPDAHISLSTYRDQILIRLAENAQVLLDILPQMEGLLGPQPPVPVLGPLESQVRTSEVFRTFLQILCDIPCPLVFVFDNVQWADEASLRLIFSTLEDRGLGNCMFIFSFRDEKGETSERLKKYIGRLNLRHNSLTFVHTQPMGVADIAEIVQDVFPMDDDMALRLAKAAYEYSDGRMRLIEVYLKEQYHAGLITPADKDGTWAWAQVSMEQAAADVADRLAAIYRRFSPETVNVVDVICCLGTEFTQETLEILFQPEMRFEEIIRALRPVMELGYLAYNGKDRMFAFASNRVRQLAYSTIPVEKRAALHQSIGRRLYLAYEDNEDALLRHSTVITNQFNQGNPQNETPQERRHVLRMNRMAGDNAMKAANTERAAVYYDTALTLLGDTPLQTDYDAAIGLLFGYAACLFALGRAEEGEALYRQIIDGARDEDTRDEAYHQIVRQYLSLSDWINAERYARAYMAGSALLPDEAGDMAAQQAQEAALYLENIRQKDLDSLLYAGMSDDPFVRRHGSMLAILAEAAIVNLNPYARCYIYRALNLAHAHGVFPDLERAIALLAERHASEGEYRRAAQVFEFGVAIAEHYGFPQSLLWAVYCSVILHWVAPLSRVPETYQKVKHIAMMEGSLYYGAFADLMLLGYELYTGTPLDQVARDVEAAIYNAERSHFIRFQTVFTSAFRQFTRCMTGRTQGPDTFDDRQFSEEALIASTDPARWGYTAQFYYVYRLMALFVNGYYREAVACADRLFAITPKGKAYSAFISRAQFYYYDSLARLRLYEADRNLGAAYLPMIAENQTHLKAYAEAQPENFATKYELIETELLRMEAFTPELLTAYSRMELAFRDAGCLWDRAVIEDMLLAQWRRQGIYHYEEVHTQKALAIYRALGARVKVLQLAGEESMDGTPSLATTARSAGGHALSTDTTMQSMSLDYQALLGVITCLVSDRNIDERLGQLLTLLMESGGAEQALLFLLHDETPYLHAVRYSEHYTSGLIAQALPLALAHIDTETVPHRVIELALGRRTQVVANSADNEYAHLGDPYLAAKRPESFLCLPILAKGKLIGVIYMENARLSDVFPPARAQFLSTIVLQASLLVQNALNVHTLEGYTVDLEKRLSTYIGQLNTLVAGIAHEINTPLDVCMAILAPLQSQAHDTREDFEAGALSDDALRAFLDEAEHGLSNLTRSLARAGELVRNFKRISIDQSGDRFEAVDLMDTLHGLVEYIRPAVKKQIGSITISGPASLPFSTSTSALAQILTNLLINSAIHAFAGMQKDACQVTLDVSADDAYVHILYADNGRGMTPEEKEKIFMPLFTTRREEGGSGLGGHIILTLVTQTLGGSVQCLSVPGRGTSYVIKLPRHLEEAAYPSLPGGAGKWPTNL